MAVFPEHSVDDQGRPLPPLGAGAACYGCNLKPSTDWCVDCPRLTAERAHRAGIRDQLGQDQPPIRTRRPWWRRLLTRKDHQS